MAKEQRLIDAYTLAEEIEALRITVAGKPAKWNDAKHSVLQVIAEQADVDAVEVVRCKDCKNGRQPWLEGQTMVKCMVGKTMLVTPEHFCSYGERRTDNA